MAGGPRCDRVPGLRPLAPARRPGTGRSPATRSWTPAARHRRGGADVGGHGLVGQEPVRAEERPQRRHRGERLREPLEGIAARLRDRLHAAQLAGRLHLVRGRARALRAQRRAQRGRGDQPARLRQRQPVAAGADIAFRQNLFNGRRRSAAMAGSCRLATSRATSSSTTTPSTRRQCR